MAINYKILNQLDEKVSNFISESGFEIPKGDIYLVAYDGDKVVGFTSLQKIVIIEPFITENPVVANNLFQRAEVLAQLMSNDLFAILRNDKLGATIAKLNFQQLENYTIWRKKWD